MRVRERAGKGQTCRSDRNTRGATKIIDVLQLLVISKICIVFFLGEYFLHNEWKNSDIVGSRSLPDPGDRLQAGNQASKKTTGRLDLQLSLLVPEPDFVVANWQIQQAVDRHIKPFLQKFPLEVNIFSNKICLKFFCILIYFSYSILC